MLKRYPALVVKDEGSEYGVVFPDFDGCVSCGATLGELRAMAAEALQLHVDGMLEGGELIPEPMPEQQAETRARAEHALQVIMVPVVLP